MKIHIDTDLGEILMTLRTGDAAALAGPPRSRVSLRSRGWRPARRLRGATCIELQGGGGIRSRRRSRCFSDPLSRQQVLLDEMAYWGEANPAFDERSG